MKSLGAALWTEILKVLKSKIFWITVMAVMFITGMIGLLMFVVKNPEFSKQFGLIGTKAAMLRFGKTDWQTYLGLLNLLVAGVGMGLFGLVTSWVFGREYSDHTLKDLLALPIARSYIVLAKFIVIFLWCAVLAFVLFAFGFAIGGLINFSDWTRDVIAANADRFWITFLLTVLLCTPAALLATIGKGFLPPIGFVLLMLMMAQFSGLLSISQFFPWAIPLAYGTGGADAAVLNSSSYIILFSTSVICSLATFAWWRFADHT